MKKRVISLAICLLLCLSCALLAASANNVDYSNETFGFSISLPDELVDDIKFDENEHGVAIRYIPAAVGAWEGLIGAIVVASPKNAYFTREYYDAKRTVLAISKDSIYYYLPVIGGVDSGVSTMAGYMEALEKLEPQQLRKCMAFKNPVSVPNLNADKLAKTAAELEGAITKSLTREYVSSIFYDAISGTVKTEVYTTHFTDINPYSSRYEAILYLEDLGVINGYGDGTFRPDSTITRAEFCTMLSRFLLIPYPWWYGNALEANDIRESHWAWDYINYAAQRGWLHESGNKIRPDEPITAHEAAQALRAVLDSLV